MEEEKKNTKTDRRNRKIINLIWCALIDLRSLTRKFKSTPKWYLAAKLNTQLLVKTRQDEMESVVYMCSINASVLFLRQYICYTHTHLSHQLNIMLNWCVVWWTKMRKKMIEMKNIRRFEGAINLKEVKIWTNLSWLYVRHFLKATNQKDTKKKINTQGLHHFMHMVFFHVLFNSFGIHSCLNFFVIVAFAAHVFFIYSFKSNIVSSFHSKWSSWMK